MMTKRSTLISPRLQYLLIAWFIICFFIAAEMKLIGFYDAARVYSDRVILDYFLMQFLAGIILIVVVVLPGYNFISSKKSLAVRIGLLILHGLIFGLCNTTMFTLLFEGYATGGIGAAVYDKFMNLLFTDFHNASRTYLIFIAILFADDFFTKNTAAIIKQKNLENEMDKVKLQALKAQLQPHFLFNALNNVVALIDENKQKAQDSLIHLSDLLRYTINLKPQQLVPIQEEIQSIKTYISIEKSKYEEQLEVDWEIAADLSDRKVPPLIIQPLVENAIKHGFINFDGRLNIKIRITPTLIEVSNNGHPLRQQWRKGQGLSIVEKRLNIHFGQAFTFTINQQGPWVTNRIVLHEDL